MMQAASDHEALERFLNSEEWIRRSSTVLTAMANGKRLKMLSLLTCNKFSVSDIARLVELDQSAASQHLAKLRKVSLVETRRHGQQIFYECRAPEVSRVLSALITNDIGQRYPTNL
ncbi:transcriptional regulator [Rhizobium sp. L9]|uniref:ArsR/SmtB family transcription factor n=1 Tax=Rhizobium sp. L9 TaxID=1340738 RepID=UPI000BE7A6A8|nr:metalloregulator ArsR/SmtB family transcription factor [Rhizobium sp. L9]PDT27975.1 transcriptional regulator [Rhizobium sp. L9]